MSDNKVFIFGSFTEDESRLFQNQSAQKRHMPPLEKAGCEHASEKLDFQFGSLDVTSLSSVKGLGNESKQTASTVASRDIRSPNLIAKDSASRNGKLSPSNDLRNASKAQANGIPNGSSTISGVSGNGKDNLDLNSMNMCEKRHSNVVTPGLDQTLTGRLTVMSDGGSEESKNDNKLSDTCSAAKPAVDAQTKLNEKALPSKSLLPRGLINLGNLCFLNATLQALLSCSPFVQLLQDLTNRNIPKVGYPTLLAFVEFISDFGVPDDSKAKKQERGPIESGKPFSPIMFDPVLNIFTPDLPSSLSGRPRQEDAQEFLSFVMDRMHDELLKLEGHFSSSNGGSLHLVSSSEDDGWETVGPKNKSAVTRTQSFIPSELSAIFGGQLRSVVKARGNKPSATVQPFLLLHLDILPDAVHTIEDALHLFSAPETLEGYKGSAGKGRKYELVATITHHGQEPSKGHYTADTRYCDSRWLRYDDACVTAVGPNKVLHDQAYVLFYKQV